MKNNILILLASSILILYIFLAGCIYQSNPSIPNQSIQKMINNASDGETIYVSSGTYNENIIINKSIILKGENKDNTFINGLGDYVVLVNSDNCTIEGFNIINRDTEQTTIGIKINTNNTTIKNNTISYSNYGVILNQSSKGNNIFNNNISNNKYGLFLLYSEENIVRNNVFINNEKGIYMTHSNHNAVYMNNISDCGYGISIVSSGNNNISDNDIFSNNLYGIYFDIESSNNIVQLNSISFNSLGIRIKGSYFNNVTKNIIEYNIKGVLTCCEANNNTIYKNIFSNNTDWNAENNNFNQWDYEGYGNFWDNYTGIDNNNDGRGDTPYIFNGGMDNYPLINKSWINKPKS